MRAATNEKDGRIIEHLLWAWLFTGRISLDLYGKYDYCPDFVN